MKYSLLIWDFDGTLADTLPIALQIYNNMAVDFGLSPVQSPARVRDMSLTEFLKTHNVPVYRVPQMFVTFLSEMKKRAGMIPLHKGISDTVRALSDRGIAQAVVSSNRTDLIESVLEKHDVQTCFQLVVGTSRLRGKEHRLRQAMRQLKAAPQQTLYAGDEIRDIEAAHATHIHCAAVTWGLNSARALKQHQPDYLIHSPADLFEVIAGTPQ